MEEKPPITAIIVDDEVSAREHLRDCLSTSNYDLNILGEADSAIKGNILIKELNPRLVFLDIEMPGGSGFDLIKSLDRTDFEVIFTTAYDHYALKAIKVAAFDYLLKPIKHEDLDEALLRFEGKSSPNLSTSIELMKEFIKGDDTIIDRLAIPSLEGLDIIKVSDIMYCEADRNYTCFFLISGEQLMVSKTLREYESLLPTNEFVRVHQKYLINLNYIKKYLKGRGGVLLMANGKYIDVARNRKADLLEVLRS